MREGSPTKGELQEIYLGEDNYVLVQIPPGIANGYKAYGDKQVILANAATEPHDPDEMLRLDRPLPARSRTTGRAAMASRAPVRRPALIVTQDADAGQLRRRRHGPAGVLRARLRGRPEHARSTSTSR